MRRRVLVALAGVLTAAVLGVLLPAGPASAADDSVAKVRFAWSGVNGSGYRSSGALMSYGVRVQFAFTKWAWNQQAPVTGRLQRKIGAHGAWRDTAQTVTTRSTVLDVRIRPYSLNVRAPSKAVVYYRVLVPTGDAMQDGDVSRPVRITYYNWHRYTGLKKQLYLAERRYCPDLAIRLVGGTPYAGQTKRGLFETWIDTDAARYSLADRRSVILHECAHHLQWQNYGASVAGWERMSDQAESIFGSNHPDAVEHMADCVSRVAEPHGYLGYGGSCTVKQLRYAKRILVGKRLY